MAALVALPLAGSQPPAGKKYALLVGVQDYDHANFTNLEFTDNDAAALAKFLRGHGYDVKLLTSKDATLARVRQELAALVKKRTRNDLVLVSLAGHGLHLDDASYFCPRDAEPTDAKTMLPLDEVYDRLKDCGAGARLLLVDACRNDPVRGVRRRGIDAAPSAPVGVGALFSCSPGQYSFETKEYKHGVFFHHVLEGLGGKAKNRKEQVTWDSLRQYVKEEVAEDAKRLFGGAKQVPNETGNLSVIPVLVEASRLAARPKAEAPKAARPKSLKAPFAATEARAAQRACADYLGVPVETSLNLGGGQKLELVLIPPGSFTMGSPSGEEHHRADETAHAVTLTRPYYIGRYPVTQTQYLAVTEENPSYFSARAKGKKGVKYVNFTQPGGGKAKVAGQNTGRHPVENVSWDDAQEFCEAVGRKAGKKVVLPSEAEWEYACRAGTTTAYYTGDGEAALRKAGWYDWTLGFRNEATHPVGKLVPNAWGLYDMHGNVAQWCQDWYGPYKGLEETDPVRLDKSTDYDHRVLRGGSWDIGPESCRTASRYWQSQRHRVCLTGFRIVVRLD
jgi:formylglycine-generating enzyme required for sulfatase activity